MNILLPILIVLLGYMIFLPVESPKTYPTTPTTKVAPVQKSMKTAELTTEKVVPKQIPSEVIVKAPVNQLPTSSDKTIKMKEDTLYIVNVSDFAFSDNDDTDSLVSIKITKLPKRGSLEYLQVKKWKKVTLNQEISKEDLEAKKLRFKPAKNKYGNKYASFSFVVSDGKDYSKDSNIITFKVTPVNDLPTASNKTIVLVEGHSKILHSTDFRFKDVESGTKYKKIKITNIVGKGSLEYFYGQNWIKVKESQEISKEDIDAKKLRFQTDAKGFAKSYGAFTFKISDGEAYSTRANKISYRVKQDMTQIFANGEKIYTKECRLCHGSSKDIVKKYKSSKLEKMLNDSVTLSEVHDKTKVSSRTHKYFQSSEYAKELSDIKYYILNN